MIRSDRAVDRHHYAELSSEDGIEGFIRVSPQYLIAMGDNTHTLTAQGVSNQDTMQVTVPADVQREQDISIDDELEVAIIGVSSLIDRASFEGRQTAGDRVTIPAQVARQLSLVAGEDYEFEFEQAEESLDDADYAVSDEEVEEAIEDEEDDSPGLGELFSTEEADGVEGI